MCARTSSSRIASLNTFKVISAASCLFSYALYNGLVLFSRDSGRRKTFLARPLMYTFQHDVEGQSEIFKAWNESWTSAGWETQALTLEDAKAHESFSELSSKLEPLNFGEYENFRFYRWAAMAHVTPDEGAWMSEIDVLPLHIKPEDGYNLPHHGTFTFHDGNEASLLSGSKAEWNKMVRHIIDNWNVERAEFSDMLMLDAVLKLPKNMVFHENDVSLGYFYKHIGAVECIKYMRRTKAVRFSASTDRNAFVGGWFEEEMRNRYGMINLKFQHKDNLQIVIDPETLQYTNMTDTNMSDIEVVIDGDSVGNIYDVLNDNHKARAMLIFMKKARHQCPLVVYVD